MKVAGYKYMKFNTDDNATIEGYKVYFFEDFEKQIPKEQRGCYFESAFISSAKFVDLKVYDIYEAQSDITLLYNKYGKIERFI